MGVIRRLPEDLANQIAAGEVVERPASVVKELVENAIDAGATRIRIDIEGGGVALIRVNDDGIGMSADDARLSVERHATSKIATIDDLRRIRSFGFRGEALPSIASVSRFTLSTCRREDDEGVKVSIEGGRAAEVLPCGIPAGTTVEVRDLFFNVPARRKFLKSVATESAHVTDLAEAAALAAPELTITLAREGRVVREWLRAATRAERVRAAFGDESLSACTGERGPLKVEAFLGRPERARAASTALTLYVNQRMIRDRSLARAVAQAYGSVLAPGRYPVGVVFLEMSPDLVDINVHPQKAEVRFSDGRAVAEALFRVLADELARAFGMPVATRTWNRPGGRPGPADMPASESLGAEGTNPEPWRFSAPQEPLADARPIAYPMRDPRDSARPPLPYAVLEAAGSSPDQVFSRLTFVCQVRQTYLICEGADGLYVLDQHACAERVMFHRLRRAHAGREIPTQALLFPVSVEVTARDAAFVDEQHAELAKLGLDVRAAGPTTVAVHAVPKMLTRADPERVVRDLIAEATRSGGRAFSNAVDLVLATMACHGSVRAGDRLSVEEATALLKALDRVDFSGHCPHGRPILMRLGWDELDRKVGRR
jgi:DNA mismatch repair protein MutL